MWLITKRKNNLNCTYYPNDYFDPNYVSIPMLWVCFM